MAETRKRSAWLYGCGVGCLVVAIGITLMVVAGISFFQRATEGFDQSIAASQELDKAHPTAAQFVPWPDGPVPADRIEAFLRVREATAPSRAGLEAVFAKLPMSRESAQALKEKSGWEKFMAVMTVGRDVMGMPSALGRLHADRDKTLLAEGMGMGEYTYLYAIVYHAWLSHPPREGPGEESDDEGDDKEGGVHVDRPDAGWRIHDEMLTMLRNQHEALGAGAPADWRAALASEIAAMEKDLGRSAWQDGLPGAIATSLEPHRDRLAASYSRTANTFELARTRKQGRFSYHSD